MARRRTPAEGRATLVWAAWEAAQLDEWRRRLDLDHVTPSPATEAALELLDDDERTFVLDLVAGTPIAGAAAWWRSSPPSSGPRHRRPCPMPCRWWRWPNRDRARPMTAPDPIYDALMRSGPGVDLAESVAELLVGLRPEWHRRAACRGAGPELFFIERGGSTAPAKALCADCPVGAECENAGQLEDHGIWNGQSPHARRSVRSSGRLRPPTPGTTGSVRPLQTVRARCS